MQWLAALNFEVIKTGETPYEGNAVYSNIHTVLYINVRNMKYKVKGKVVPVLN
jgi:hypothetical protein